MQSTPLTKEQCSAVRSVLQSVLDALHKTEGDLYDSGDRIAVCLKKRDVLEIRRAVKKL